jgi:hypothetical protein
MIQIISWNCVDILDVCVECVLPSSHHLTSKTCLCLSDADFLQQKCLLALEVEHPIGHYFLDCSAWPRSGLRTKDMAAWCNTLWSWCRLKKHCNICATSTLKRTRRSQDPNLCHFHVPCDKMHSNLILACSCFVATWDLFCLGDTSDNCFVSGLPCLIFSWNWRLFFVPPFCSVSESTWVWQEDGWENSKFMFSFNPNTYEQSSKKHSGRISLSCFACPSAHNLPNFKHIVCGPWTTAYFYNILVIGFS